MSKTHWEYDLVERPFCEQLKAMGWQWIEGDTDVPDFTERESFREVLLKGRLAAALRKLNRRDGQPWLDDDRIGCIIEKLEKAEGHRLMEINESATKLLLKGTEIDGLGALSASLPSRHGGGPRGETFCREARPRWRRGRAQHHEARQVRPLLG